MFMFCHVLKNKYVNIYFENSLDVKNFCRIRTRFKMVSSYGFESKMALYGLGSPS